MRYKKYSPFFITDCFDTRLILNIKTGAELHGVLCCDCLIVSYSVCRFVRLGQFAYSSDIWVPTWCTMLFSEPLFRPKMLLRVAFPLNIKGCACSWVFETMGRSDEQKFDNLRVFFNSFEISKCQGQRERERYSFGKQKLIMYLHHENDFLIYMRYLRIVFKKDFPYFGLIAITAA